VRIVSLLPAATELLFALEAGGDVVGVTFECDYPPEALTRRIVSTTTLPGGLSPAEIDAAVTARLAAGEDLYHLERDALADLDPDLVVTQDLCAVCALDVTKVGEALEFLGCRAQVVTLDPHTLDDVLASVRHLGEVLSRREAADTLVEGLRERLAAVAAAVIGKDRPGVLVLEWTDPPFAPGHWVPEMVEAAGGRCVLGSAGEPSFRTTWETVADAAADVVVVAPCGYDLPGSAALARQIVTAGLLEARVPVWAVDADGCFARPGPRLVDGIETLAAILHPDDSSPVAGAQLVRPAGAVRT
jgi:iron complex transport system substrate-binding protein